MKTESAGILLYRFENGNPEFFLVHPGGPFWAKKDANSWSIPKGEIGEGEDAYDAALREFREETGFILNGKAITLTPVIQKSGKRVHAFALEGNADPSQLKSNSFSMEWPPRSGKTKEFPEIDRAAWFDYGTACIKIIVAQIAFLDELKKILGI